MTLGVIGAGNMGGAIVRGLLNAGCIREEDVTATASGDAHLAALKQEHPAIHTAHDNRDAARCHLVVIAVKPWLVEKVLGEIGDVLQPGRQMLLNVAAGISFSQFYAWLPEACREMPLFRFIPNTAISIGESMSLFAATHATQDQIDLVLNMFRCLGGVMLLPEEKMAAGTALTSCGIAYALRYVRAAVEGAVEMGFPAAEATRMVAQTVKGAAELLLKNQSHPEAEIDKVTTPGGITIKGLNAMEAEGFTAAVIAGLKASR